MELTHFIGMISFQPFTKQPLGTQSRKGEFKWLEKQQCTLKIRVN
jgi:hypothetical protein